MSPKNRYIGKAAARLMQVIKGSPTRIKIYFLLDWKHILIRISAIVFILVLWYLIVIMAREGNQFLMEYRFHDLPTPQETWSTFVESLSPSDETKPIYKFSILDHAAASIMRVIIGFIFASVVAIPLGLSMARFKYVEDFGGPIVELFRPIPPLAWIGIAIFIFTHYAGYFIVFIGCSFPIILSTMNGVKALDEGLIEAAKTLGAKKFDIFRKVIIPGSLPSIVTGMRIGLGIGWMSIVAAEMIGMRDARGLGNYLWTSYSSYGNNYKMVVAMLLIGFIGWGMNYIIQKVEKRVIRWQE